MGDRELFELLCRCVDEYHWLWGVTRKYLYAKTGIEYDVKDLKRLYISSKRQQAIG